MTNSESTPDWATRATEAVGNLTETIRDHSVKPLGTVIRAIGVGVAVGLAGLVALAVILIALVRIFDTDVFAGRVWAIDLLLGGMFAVAGVFLLRRGSKVWNRND